jgi:hypothetical protein
MACVLVVPAALAQPEQPKPAKPDNAEAKKPEAKKPEAKKPEAKKPEAKKPEPDASDESDAAAASGDKEDEEKPSAKKSDADLPPEHDEEVPPAPPPPPPRVDEQLPRPYLERPKPIAGVRHIEIGPDAGIWSRPAKGDAASYSAAFAWGAHARIEILPVLGFAAYFNAARHSVTVRDARIDQPPIEVMQIGARLEPTWPVLPTLRLWAGVGVAWGRVKAPSPSVTDVQDVPDRTAVFLEYSGALGGTYDVLPHWLAISLSLSGGLVKNQSGDAFDESQVIDQTGFMSRLAGLPEFEGSYSALLGVGMIL